MSKAYPTGRPEGSGGHGEEPSRDSLERGHEASDIRLRPILMAGLILAVLGVVGPLVLFPVFDFVLSRQAAQDPPLPPLARTDQTPPEPRLQTSPPRDWEELVTRQRAILDGYSWVDQPGGAVRIPIERAMDLIVERDLLPVRPDTGEMQTWPEDEYSELDSEGGQPPEQDRRTRPPQEGGEGGAGD